MFESRVPGFATLAVHAGSDREDFHEAALSGPVPALEERVAALEGGTAAVATPSIESAVQILFRALLRPGDELVVSSAIYERSLIQILRSAKAFGGVARPADPDDPQSFEREISPRSKAILVETLSSGAGRPADLDYFAQLAKRAGVPLLVDNTLATPFLCRPANFGADIVLHAAEAFLGGHGRAGILVDAGSFDWMREARYPAFAEERAEFDGRPVGEAVGNYAFAAIARLLLAETGTALAPADAALILAGLETLPLRIARQSASARAVAEFLVADHRVDWVDYAGLPGNRYYNLGRKYLAEGAGAIVGFGLRSSEAAGPFRARLGIIGSAASPGGSRTVLLDQPSGQAGQKSHRLSIGLEDAGDLIADLDRALGARPSGNAG